MLFLAAVLSNDPVHAGQRGLFGADMVSSLFERFGVFVKLLLLARTFEALRVRDGFLGLELQLPGSVMHQLLFS